MRSRNKCFIHKLYCLVKSKIDYLIVSGGSAAVEGLDTLLSEELGMHTVIADPFQNMTISENIDKDELAKNAAQYMVAAGLALRSFSPWHI